jgi:Transcriptional regulator PadR-like family
MDTTFATRAKVHADRFARRLRWAMLALISCDLALVALRAAAVCPSRRGCAVYELIILSLLMREPMHGYLIAKVTNDQIGPWARLSSGTMYTILARLEADGLIATPGAAVAAGAWPKGQPRARTPLEGAGVAAIAPNHYAYRGALFMRASRAAGPAYRAAAPGR